MKDCKHRFEPTNFGIKYRNPNSYWWSCIRCGKTIFHDFGEKNDERQHTA